VNVQAIHCPACERRWPVGANVSHYERQTLEAAPCPACGRHVLKCIPVPDKAGRRAAECGPGPAAHHAG
jgi:hypothetical protein